MLFVCDKSGWDREHRTYRFQCCNRVEILKALSDAGIDVARLYDHPWLVDARGRAVELTGADLRRLGEIDAEKLLSTARPSGYLQLFIAGYATRQKYVDIDSIKRAIKRIEEYARKLAKWWPRPGEMRPIEAPEYIPRLGHGFKKAINLVPLPCGASECDIKFYYIASLAPVKGRSYKTVKAKLMIFIPSGIVDDNVEADIVAASEKLLANIQKYLHRTIRNITIHDIEHRVTKKGTWIETEIVTRVDTPSGIWDKILDAISYHIREFAKQAYASVIKQYMPWIDCIDQFSRGIADQIVSRAYGKQTTPVEIGVTTPKAIIKRVYVPRGYEREVEEELAFCIDEVENGEIIVNSWCVREVVDEFNKRGIKIAVELEPLRRHT